MDIRRVVAKFRMVEGLTHELLEGNNPLVILLQLVEECQEVWDAHWILRRLLQEMNPVDAMEFMMDKIRKADTNQIFLDSMNS